MEHKIKLKAELSLKTETTLKQHLPLSLTHQQRLSRKWDERLKDPLAFTPSELRDQVTVLESLRENYSLGAFGAEYLASVVFSERNKNTVRRREKNRRQVVAVGYGKSYDSMWLREATLAGYHTWWIDVSQLACEWAEIDMKRQWEMMEKERHELASEPVVKQGEIRSILADPGMIGLDLDFVEVWYLCRTLTCLSWASARVVLQLLGRSLREIHDPNKQNKIILVGALADIVGVSKVMSGIGVVIILLGVLRVIFRAKD